MITMITILLVLIVFSLVVIHMTLVQITDNQKILAANANSQASAIIAAISKGQS